jgi:hypothetical protein
MMNTNVMKDLMEVNGIVCEYRFQGFKQLVDECIVKIEEQTYKVINEVAEDIDNAINESGLKHFMELGLDVQLLSSYANISGSGGDYEIKQLSDDRRIATIVGGAVTKFERDITPDNIDAFKVLYTTVLYGIVIY